MFKFIKKLCIIMLIVSMLPINMSKVSATDMLPDLYNPNFQTKSIKVLSKDEAEKNNDVKVCMVRQSNKKITFMIKDDKGIMQPFYPKAIETGFWDTRKQGQVTDWDTVFQDYKDLGVNTVQLMIHWSDWEPKDGVFDYKFMDSIVNKAAGKGLKVYFVIFFHYQWNMDTKYDDFWAYHLEDKDGTNKSIMWGKGSLNNISNIRNSNLEIFPEYWHPMVYKKLIEAITNLAEHYKDSKDVIAYQLGNEEGFNYYLNNGNDTNPYYKQLFNKWKSETGGKDEGEFRLKTIQNLWKHMSTAVHNVDPYKPTTTNFQGGLPEKNGGKLDWNEGVNCEFYRDANLDMIGTMFYGNDCYKIWNNLDNVYDYTKSIPVLFPSEIGAKGLNSIAMKTYLINSLERGACGFGIYCYGEMLNTIHEQNLRNLMTMINYSEDIIYNGIPVSTNDEAKNIFLHSVTSSVKVSNLEKDEKSDLGMVYFPNTVRNEVAEENVYVSMNLEVKKADTYTIETYVDGNLVSTTSKLLPENGSYNWNINMSNYSNSFIKVTASSTSIPEAKKNIALGGIATSDSEEVPNFSANAIDGSEFSRWCAINGNTEHWLMIDLGKEHNISSSEIVWEKKNGYKYKIEVSNNKLNWTIASDKTNNLVASQRMIDTLNTTARYVRITVTGGVSSTVWPSLYEFKIYD